MSFFVKLTILCSLLFITLQADTITLKNGSILNGTVLSQDDSTVKFQNASNIQTIKRTDLINIRYGSSPINNRPLLRLAVGAGTPYAMTGTQLGLFIDNRTEIIVAFTLAPNLNSSFYFSPTWYSTLQSNYAITSYGIRFYCDKDTPTWLPGTGTYISLGYMSYKYNFNSESMAGGPISQTKYTNEASAGLIGLGLDGNIWFFRANAELCYTLVLSDTTTYTYGSSGDIPIIPSGLTLALGLGIAF